MAVLPVWVLQWSSPRTTDPEGRGGPCTRTHDVADLDDRQLDGRRRTTHLRFRHDRAW